MCVGCVTCVMCEVGWPLGPAFIPTNQSGLLQSLCAWSQPSLMVIQQGGLPVAPLAQNCGLLST